MSNEAKTTKAYKISPELKEKLERLAAESGLETQEAFIEQLAALYELQQLKEGNGSGYRKQIEELEYHLSRPLALFTSMIETEAAARLDMSQQHEEKVGGLSVELFAQQEEIATLKKEAKAQADELARIAKDNESQIKLVEQLQESVRDKGLIVDQRGQEIATLSSLVNEYKAAADENKELKTEVSRLTTITEKQAKEIDELKIDKQVIDDQRVRELEQLEERHREALERQAERKDVEKERELLAIRTEYHTKFEKEQEVATTKIREMYEQRDQLREEIAKLQQQPKADDGGGKPSAKK